MKHLELSHIKQVASTLEGQKLETIGRKLGFRLEIEPDDGLFYVLESNGNRRRQTWKDIQSTLDHFNETNSFRSSDYSNITRCASYLLPIIRVALESH